MHLILYVGGLSRASLWTWFYYVSSNRCTTKSPVDVPILLPVAIVTEFFFYFAQISLFHILHHIIIQKTLSSILLVHRVTPYLHIWTCPCQLMGSVWLLTPEVNSFRWSLRAPMENPIWPIRLQKEVHVIFNASEKNLLYKWNQALQETL